MRRDRGVWCVLLLLPLVGCRVMVREATWRPDVDDRSGLSEAYLSDSGLLLVCGAVTDTEFMREARARGDEQTLVYRTFTHTLALGDDPGLGSTLEQVDVDRYPSLTTRRGSGACDFERRRASLFPEETGWIRIGMAWVGNYPVPAERVRGGDLPPPKEGRRASLYTVDDELGTVYLFVGRATPDGPYRNLLLRLGTGHIETLWRESAGSGSREVRVTRWGLFTPAPTIAHERTGDGTVAVVGHHQPPVLQQQATEVEVRLGDRIGIQYEGLGVADRVTFPVEIELHHPPIEGQVVSRWNAVAQGGVELYTGWHFWHRCQLLPGAWRFEVRHDGRVLAAKELVVSIAPGQPGAEGCPGSR